MHSLYWRIFFTFWLALALILVGTVTVAVNAASQHRTESAWFQRGQLYASAARAFESGGPTALKTWLEDLGFIHIIGICGCLRRQCREATMCWIIAERL